VRSLPATRAALWHWLRQTLADGDIAEPEADARRLFADLAGIDRLALLTDPDAPVDPALAARLAEAVARRLAGEPVGRIIGWRMFHGLRFALSPGTLEPRDDSESVIDLALACCGPDHDRPLTLLDIGTGTGCLLIALLHELPRAFGIGLDLDANALATARSNAVTNGVAARAGFVRGRWGAGVAPVDLVISNPPYIPSDEIATLAREVRQHDPALALNGGPDGLDAYRAILADARRLLKPGGHLVLEIGAGQGADVTAMAAGHGLTAAGTRDDLGGHRRALAFRC
jgi:release factor glutamine methyltransferase